MTSKKISIVHLTNFTGKKRGSELSIEHLFSLLKEKINVIEIQEKKNNDIEKRLKETLKKEKVDFLVGQNTSIPFTVNMGKKYGISSLVFIRDTSFIETSAHKPFYVKAIKPFMLFPKFKEALRNADGVISNSEYMKKKLKDKLGVKSEVIYPVVNFKKISVSNRTGDYVGMIIPTKNKGFEIFKKIAKKMPREKFLVAGEGKDPKISNLEFMGYQKDMKRFYKKIRLLLVPSVWNEAFGRVVLEAQNNGIPVISSGRGGLKEVTAGSIIQNLFDISEWIGIIKSYINEEKYKKKQKEGFIKNKRFKPKVQAKKFYEILELRKYY